MKQPTKPEPPKAAAKKAAARTETRRTKQPELITLGELAKRAGVSRPAVTAFLKKQLAAGAIEVYPGGFGRRSKCVDAQSPVVRAFIDNTLGAQDNRTMHNGAAAAPEASIRKLRAAIRKNALKTEMLRAKYIPTDFVFRMLDKYMEISEKAYAEMNERIPRRLQEEFGPIPPEKIAEAREILEGATTKALEMSARLIADFKRDNAPVKTAEA